MKHPERNPLLGSTAAETCAFVAAALSWIMAADPDRLTDRALREGLYHATLPVVAALEAVAARAEDHLELMLDHTRAARLLVLATRHAEGNLLAALDRAMDALEAAETQASKVDETPEARRARYERVRDLAQTWIDEVAPAHEKAPTVASDRGVGLAAMQSYDASRPLWRLERHRD